MCNIHLLLEHVFEGRKRKTGDPYITHPYAVKEILENVGINEISILNAALLHDVLEDTDIQKVYLTIRFGQKIANIVEILSKKNIWNTSYCTMKNNLDEMEGVWLYYPEAVIIKMADRLHNLQTIHGFSYNKQREYIKETKQLLLPLFKLIIEKNHLGYLKKPIEILYNKLITEYTMIGKRIF